MIGNLAICFGKFGLKSKKLIVNQHTYDFQMEKSLEYVLKNQAKPFSFKELQHITNNFTTKLGIGELSSCYKGTLENGTMVAVKVLSVSNVDRRMDIEFLALMKIMSEIKHQNVVEFIGACVEDHHRIIVYKFMGGGSLGALLDDRISELSWHMRASICLGIARGLEYLHYGGTLRVLHRDFRPNNVLLDKGLNPKIVDFGLVHVFSDYTLDDKGAIPKHIGYIDPENFLHGRWTEKGDVYAFGVVLLEVISGRRVSRFWKDGKYLVNWAWELGKSDKFMEIIDPSLSEVPEDEVKCYISVALSCVQSSSDLRPTMAEVSLMLSGGLNFNKDKTVNESQSKLAGLANLMNSIVIHG